MKRFRAHTALIVTTLLLALIALPGCVAYSDSYYGGGPRGRGYYAQGGGGGGWNGGGWGHRPPPPAYGWR